MLNILFPKICNGCKTELIEGEKILCSQCRQALPLACHHRINDASMKNIFYGRFPVEHATALIQFQKKGISQQILHNLKYRGQHQISAFFGAWLGAELSEIKSFQNIDMVIPVPLHKEKLKTRGYNQVDGFGQKIADALGVDFRKDILLKISKTKSQVFKKRFSRIQSEEIFHVSKPELLENKHILLVDDIVTTGATLEHCASQLLNGNNAKLSVATIAIA